MLELQAIRSELAGYAPAGWQGYDYTPGAAALPAFVVALPDRIEPNASLTLVQVELPLVLVVAHTDEAEQTLIAGVESVVNALITATAHASFMSVRPLAVDQFLNVTVATAKALAAQIRTEVKARL